MPERETEAGGNQTMMGLPCPAKNGHGPQAWGAPGALRATVSTWNIPASPRGSEKSAVPGPHPGELGILGLELHLQDRATPAGPSVLPGVRMITHARSAVCSCPRCHRRVDTGHSLGPLMLPSHRENAEPSDPQAQIGRVFCRNNCGCVQKYRHGDDWTIPPEGAGEINDGRKSKL